MPEKIAIDAGEVEREIIAVLDRMADKPGGPRTKPGCNLRHGSGCALGTCVDNRPRVTPVDFFHEGLTIWIAGEPGGKIANIMRNPTVSVGIYEPVDHSRQQSSLQIFGTAEIINAVNNPELFAAKFAQFGLDEALAGMVEAYVGTGLVPEDRAAEMREKVPKIFNWIKITPERIILLQMLPGQYPVKKTWELGRAVLHRTGLR